MKSVYITPIVGAILCVMSALALTAPARASSVIVESMTVPPCSSFSVGVFLQNDYDLGGLVIPLVVRKLDGSQACLGSWSGGYVPGARLDGFLTEVTIYNEYDTEDGTCKEGLPGGFGTVGAVGNTDPDAFLFIRKRILGPDWPAGSDGYPSGTPSIEVLFSLPSFTGPFFED